MAEQRLAQRNELSQERQQHIADLTQVNWPQAQSGIPTSVPFAFPPTCPLHVCVLTLCQQQGRPALLRQPRTQSVRPSAEHAAHQHEVGAEFT